MVWSVDVDAFVVDGISYDVLSESDRTVCVARQKVTDLLTGDVRIPNVISYEGKNYTVTEISGWAFSSCSQMTSISIPAAVQRIGYSAFWGCYGLQSVHIEDIASWCSVVQEGGTEGSPLRLAHHLHVNGEEVTELVIPEGVTAISYDAFHDATAITSVVIPSSVKRIGADAFAGCKSLISLSLPDGLEVIEDYAFEGCCRFTEITIPDKVQVLHWDSFRGCTGLEKVSLGSSLTEMHAGSFYGCDNIQQVWSNIKEPFDVTAYDRHSFPGHCKVGQIDPEAFISRKGPPKKWVCNNHIIGGRRNLSDPISFFLEVKVSCLHLVQVHHEPASHGHICLHPA